MDSVTLAYKLSFVFIPLIFVIGIYCIIVTHNLIRTLIGIELLAKAVTLFIIVAGYITGHAALAQSLVITFIIIEVVIIAVAAGIVINVARVNGNLDARNLRNLKG